MAVNVEWAGESRINCTNKSGKSIMVDWELGPSPVEVLAQMAGACSLVDVVIGLKQRTIHSANVYIDYQRATDLPKVITHMHMIYRLSGEEIPQKLVEGLITQSHEKYCSVSNTMNGVTEFSWELELNNS